MSESFTALPGPGSVAAATDLTRGAGDGFWSRTRALGWTWLVTFVSLWVAIAVVPGIEHDGFWPLAWLALVVGVVGVVLRPVLNRLALALGWIGIFLLAVFAQVIVLAASIALTRGVSTSSVWSLLGVAWLSAVVATVVGFLDSTDEEEVFLAHVVRTSLRRRRSVAVTDEPGVIFVQIDGVPMPVLEFAVLNGTVPTMSRWVRAGTHTMAQWTARVPCNTPVGQAGLLHGTTRDLPGFRWYDRKTGKLVVTNHPPDARAVEDMISDGRGLLIDDGVSIANMFSGDAPSSLLTMSGVGRGVLGDPGDYAAFFATPYGFARSLTRTVAEMAIEVRQARRQVARGVQPRVRRVWTYVLLRGLTHVLLRDVITALLVEQMLYGRKVIFADYLDYDKIAHYAGVGRAESVRALEAVDRLLGLLERVAKFAPRPYHFVVVSDHGQSQGATFRQRYGVGLEDVVRELMGGADGVAAATGHDEDWGQLNVFLSELREQSSVSAAVSRGVLRDEGSVSLGPHDDAVREVNARPEVVVAASGNLGAVCFAREPGRLDLEQIEQCWPRLVRGLVAHPGVALVVAATADGAVAVGPAGVRRLIDGTIIGIDPFAVFGDQAERAASDYARIAVFANAPDLYVNSSYDPVAMEVAAFEELVGSHGGIGGWQSRAVLLYPAGWPVHGELIGAEAVHQHFVGWLEMLGHRRNLPDTDAGGAGNGR